MLYEILLNAYLLSSFLYRCLCRKQYYLVVFFKNDKNEIPLTYFKDKQKKIK